ncbi:hypothetical protein E2C01_035075 [Portunus trituberculatus]|uniref:Uncharacterized protein n=1 Tax=Portunus trituberculatus TaxID=210409 RepID=A0A5B7F4L1_PORTR|nr:hypothetical protein [Portunus trituberculatus]
MARDNSASAVANQRPAQQRQTVQPITWQAGRRYVTSHASFTPLDHKTLTFTPSLRGYLSRVRQAFKKEDSGAVTIIYTHKSSVYQPHLGVHHPGGWSALAGGCDSGKMLPRAASPRNNTHSEAGCARQRR